MIYVGIDLHRKRSHIAAVDERGVQVLSRRIANDADVFEALIAELEDEAKFAPEATYGWEWLAQLLEDRGCELHLAHPLRTKAIASARVKTDAVDARTPAHLVRADLLPEAYIAPRELRDLRDLLRQRVVLTQMRTALKNRVDALMARHGIQRQHSDLFGAGGRRGLTPTVRSSDAKARLGHISAMGSTAPRWALVEAAQKTSQGGGPLRDSFERIAKRRGRQIAKAAIARKILTLRFYELRDGDVVTFRFTP